MAFSARCRYCRRILATADYLGEREAAGVRAHLTSCCPNLDRPPWTIGELLGHLSITVVPRSTPAPFATRAEPALAAPSHAVLVVDPDEHGREAVTARLVAAGFAVSTAVDAVGALRQLHAGFDPCALVMHLRLPRIGGWPLASWLAHHPRYASIPILAVGGDADGGSAADVAGVVVTDAGDEALIAAVSRYCRPAEPT